ncbi:MAG: DUF262 domain-containing protein [Proteobacteria bacterium]|nr:DUF262 domain-containing protein [Pseudomonadota bacterium]
MADEEELAVDGAEQAEEEAFVTYDIAAYPADYTLSVLNEMWENDDIIIPPFQRKFVWTIKQSSMLIESLLMGLPVPQAFFFVDTESRNLVIDGLQRVMSIVYFLKGYFGEEDYQGKKTVFRLTGLSEKSPYANKTFDELDEGDKRKLKGRVLRVILIKQLGPRDEDTSAYHIFERLNTGGTPLTAQEIRHCVFNGDLVDSLTKLNSDGNWRKIVGRQSLDKRQKDIEMILRVLAVATRIDKYEKPMKEFLNTTMSHYRNAEAPEVKAFIAAFPVVCKSVVEKLGEKPFNINAGRINVSALDGVMGLLCSAAGRIPDNLAVRYATLKDDAEFRETLSVSTSDSAVVNRRIKSIKRILLDA